LHNLLTPPRQTRALRFRLSLRSLYTVALSIYERRRIAVLATVSLLAIVFVRTSSGNSNDATPTTVTTTTVPPVIEQDIPESVILGGPAPLAPTGSAVIAYPADTGNSIGANRCRPHHHQREQWQKREVHQRVQPSRTRRHYRDLAYNGVHSACRPD
jgi:hypothetical protein